MSVTAPSATPEHLDERENVGYELFIGALSVLSVLNIFILFFMRDPSIEQVIGIMNAIFVPIFLGDFLFRFFTTQDKRRYFFREWGWADLLSSLPFPRIKIFRLFRIWRVIRLLQRYGLGGFAHEFNRNRAQNALMTVAFLVIVLLEFGSLSVLYFELASPDSNIKNASDALWWVYVTVTTVGYGDYFPVTNEGRVVAIVVMTAGVGLFGTLSGFLANKLLSPRKIDEAQSPATLPPDPTSISQAPTPVGSPPVTAAAMNLALEMPDYLASGSIDERIAVLRAILDANQRFTDRVRNELDAIEGILQDEASSSG